MSHIRRIKIALLFLLCAGNLFAQEQKPPFWDDIQSFKKADSVSFPTKNAILFIGSSSFTMWKDVQNDFPGYKIINRAFGASTLLDQLRYVNEIVFPYNPQQIIIYCGENDLASSDTVSSSLSWSTSTEESFLEYIIERSYNGIDFFKAGSINSYNNNAATNQYSFIDPVSFTDKAWYRIIIVTPEGKKKYSSIIQLKKNMPGFDFGNIINPFNNTLVFDIIVDRNATIAVNLIDMAGRTVLSGNHKVYPGVNNLTLSGAQAIQSGVYTLQVINTDSIIRKRVIKR